MNFGSWAFLFLVALWFLRTLYFPLAVPQLHLVGAFCLPLQSVFG